MVGRNGDPKWTKFDSSKNEKNVCKITFNLHCPQAFIAKVIKYFSI